jgi:hypothetical protein
LYGAIVAATNMNSVEERDAGREKSKGGPLGRPLSRFDATYLNTGIMRNRLGGPPPPLRR